MAKENKLGFVVALASALALTGSTSEAFAADPPAEPVPVTSRADALFTEGKQLMEQGKFVEACDKLAESDALDPAIGTLGLLATCHEQQGRIATAWREYTQTAARADAVADDRGTFARERAKALEPELPKVLVRLAVVDPNVVVLRNGVRLTTDELGVAMPMDPGTYEIIARWPDKPEFRTMVTVVARKLVEVEVPNPNVPQGKSPVGAKPGDVGKPLVVNPVGPKSTSMSGVRVGALVAGGVGLVGFGMATAFGISAASKNSASISIHSSCMNQAACEDGKDLRQQALSAATLANVGLGIGVVGAASAVVLALLPNRSATAVSDTQHAQLMPWAGPNGAGALIVGHF